MPSVDLLVVLEDDCIGFGWKNTQHGEYGVLDISCNQMHCIILNACSQVHVQYPEWTGGFTGVWPFRWRLCRWLRLTNCGEVAGET